MKNPVIGRVAALVIATACLSAAALIVAGVSMSHTGDVAIHAVLSQNVEEIRSVYTDRLMGIVRYAEDYASWEELRQFVYKPDTSWAAENLTTTAQTMGLDLRFVLDNRGEVLFKAGSIPVAKGDVLAELIPLRAPRPDRAGFQGLWKSGDSYYVIGGAWIYGDRSRAHAEPNGLLINGYRVTPEWLGRTGRLTQERLAVRSLTGDVVVGTAPTTSKSPDRRRGYIEAGSIVLRDINGGPSAMMAISSYVPLVREANEFALHGILLVVLFGVLSVGIISAGLRFWVLKPLHHIEDGLRRQEAGEVVDWSGILRTGDEFELLARAFGRASDALGKSQRNMADILENAADAVLVLDASAQVIMCNGRARDLLGADQDTPAPRLLLSFLPSEYVPLAEEALVELVETGSFFGELPMQRPNGEQIVTEANCIMLEDGRLVIALRDITERKQAEQALAEHEEYLRKLHEFLTVGILVVDAETHRIVDANRAAATLMGGSKQSIIGTPCDCFKRPRTSGLCPVSDLHQTIERDERTILRMSGEEVSVMKTVVPITLGGRKYLLESLVDISERKRAENALKRRMQIESTVYGLATHFVSHAEVDDAIHAALGDIARLSDADRSYVFQVTEDGACVTNTHEWCAEGVTPQKEHFQDRPLAEQSWLVKVLQNSEPVRISDVTALPAEAWALREKLEMRGVRSVLGLPLWLNGTLAGFVGFDDTRSARTWSDDDVAVLRMFCDILSNALGRKRTEVALVESQERFRQMAEAIPHVFWMMSLAPVAHLYASPGYELIYGLPREDLAERPMQWLESVHPEDRPSVAWNIANPLQAPEESEFRFLHSSGEVRWLRTRQFKIANAAGEVVRIAGVTEDITQRKQAEEALRESEERLRAITNSAQDAIIMMDDNGAIRFWNPAAERIFGHTASEVAGRDLHMLLAPERIRAEWEAGMSRFQKTGEGRALGRLMELPALRKDGTEIPVELSLSSISNGQRRWVVGMARDIAERKRAQEALSESEHRYRSVVESVKEVIFQTDADGNWTFLNPAWTEITGFGVTESIGTLFLDYVHPDDRELNEERFRPLIERKKEYCRHEIRYLKRNGGHRWVEVYARLVINADGEITGTAGTLNDITERKRAEAAHAASERRLSVILEASPAAIIVSRFTDGGVLFVNQRLCQDLGMARAEALESNLSSFCHDPADLRSLLRQLLRYGVVDSREIRLRGANGTIYWALVSARTFELDGEPVIVAGAMDIGDRKRMEEELKLAKGRAESANQAKSEFLANMSHEIRTPMNAIIGFSGLLGGMIEDSRQREYLDAIDSSGKDLLRLINDILDLSKIEAGKMDISPRPVDLREFTEEIRRIYSYKAAEKGVSFHAAIDSSLPESLLLDEVRLRQVMINLVGNAIKFTSHGEITLRVNAAASDVKRSTIDLIFEVEDCGIGIPLDQQESIFDAFVQKRGQDSGQFGGTGLGLAISRRLVEMMGGGISVSSVEGKGSLFMVRIPGVHVSSTKTVKVVRDETALPAQRHDDAVLLLVEDNAVNRMLVHAMLGPTGIRIVEAENGLVALEAARASRPDIILMDIQMPVMDGFEATSRLKSDEDLRHIPVIMLTASAMGADEARARESGCDGFITKPIDRRQLLRTLRSVLGISARSEAADAPAADVRHATRSGIPHSLDAGTLEELEGPLQAEWKILCSRMVVGDIAQFAAHLLDFGQRHHLQEIVQWGETVQASALEFRVDDLVKELRDFPALIETLKSVRPQDTSSAGTV